MRSANLLRYESLEQAGAIPKMKAVSLSQATEISASNMSHDQTERAEDIYCSALEIKSPAERKVFLDRACRGDAGFRLEVDRWLAMQPAAGKFFQEIDVARLLTETFLHLPSHLPAKAAQGHAGGAGANQVPGQDANRI